MRTVTKRELNQQTARVLAEVAAEGPVVVTERGVPKWRIDLMTGSHDAVEVLFAQGRITRAETEPAPWGPEDGSRPASDVDALLEELRDER